MSEVIFLSSTSTKAVAAKAERTAHKLHDQHGVDLCEPVLEGGPFDLILYLAIAENAFQGNDSPLIGKMCRIGELSF
jgi:hypothetical protein